MAGDIIGIVAVLLIIAGAAWYIIRAKKRGAKCIGCPAGECACGQAQQQSSCGGNCSGCSCGCGGENN